MSTTITINNILSQVKQLDKEEQFTLLQKLLLLLKPKVEATDDSIKITSLSGMGSEVWKGIDIDKYIENERQW